MKWLWICMSRCNWQGTAADRLPRPTPRVRLVNPSSTPHVYYMLRSSLQIQHSALLDDGMSRAHYLTPGRTCCEGFYQNYSHSVFQLFIVTENNFTICVTQFALFRSLETVLVLYNLIIRVLCFNAHVTCIHSNSCSRFDMIEPLDKTLPDFKSPARDVLSSNTAERRICRFDRNV